jgi:hypothetical protein
LKGKATMARKQKPLILCGKVPSTGRYSILFWDKHARTYWPELPFAQALGDHRFQGYVADAVCTPPAKRDRSQLIAIEIAKADA